MNLKELNYIVTIADEGSISRAAEKLYMAQSSLSQFLQLYEAELGAPLFMRTSRGVRPTASGSVFLNHARQILLQYHRAQSELWDIEELSGGRIELGISTFRGTYLLPPVLKRFRDRYPRIHVEITEKDSMYLEEMILEGFLDMALLALPSPRLHKQLDFLTRDEIYLVTVSEHPVMEFVHREEDGTRWVDLKDIARFECILGTARADPGLHDPEGLRGSAPGALGPEHQYHRPLRCRHGPGGDRPFLYVSFLYGEGPRRGISVRGPERALSGSFPGLSRRRIPLQGHHGPGKDVP